MPELETFEPSLPREAWPAYWHRADAEHFRHHGNYLSYWVERDRDGPYALMTYRTHGEQIEGVWMWVREDRRGGGAVHETVTTALTHEAASDFAAPIETELAAHYREEGFGTSRDDTVIYLVGGA